METLGEVSPVRAAVVGDKSTVIDWLKHRRHDSRADFNTIHDMLMQAAKNGNTDICQLIINTGVVFEDDMLTVALEAACGMGHLSTAQLLIQHCDTNNTQCLQTALGLACGEGQLTVVNWLMDVMKLSPADTIKWLMMTASARGDINTVRQLVRREALYTSDVVSDGLRGACYKGTTNVVDWLMTHTSADPGVRGLLYHDRIKVTSLNAACRNVRSIIIQILLSNVTPHTVNMQCTDTRNSALGQVISFCDPALHNSCADGDIDKVNKRLYTCNVDEQEGNSGDTLLHRACQFNHVKLVSVLLSVFAGTDITDDNGWTPIEVARQRCFLNIVKLMEDPMLTGTDTSNINTARVNNVTPVVISHVTIHSGVYHQPDKTNASVVNTGNRRKQKRSTRSGLRC
jgi:ankyrin repeat protein